ncbi:MAG: GNAT family N-acetyltransferase [Bryobacteraceae bacterium]|nr:GNAT family N-acetyltransferase [Bryobacteraceae bacterium]
MLLGVALGLKDSDPWDETFYTYGDAPVEGAFVYAPSRGIMVSAPASPRAIDSMVAKSLTLQSGLAGVVGPRPHSDEVVRAWSRETGSPMELAIADLLYELTHPKPAPAAPGQPRLAAPHEASMLVDWSGSLARETGEFFDPAFARHAVARRIARNEIWIWAAPDAVCMLRISPTGAGGNRITSVFTPPPHRRNGYASSLLGHVLQLTAPTPCFLSTAAVNAVANRIYQRLGFQRAGEFAQFKPVV